MGLGFGNPLDIYISGQKSINLLRSFVIQRCHIDCVKMFVDETSLPVLFLYQVYVPV